MKFQMLIITQRSDVILICFCLFVFFVVVVVVIVYLLFNCKYATKKRQVGNASVNK